MRTNLTHEQISRYHDQGFLHIEKFLGPDEIQNLKQSVLETISHMGAKKVAGDGAALQEEDRFYDRVFTQRLNLWKINDVVKNFFKSRDLGKMMCQLEGIDSIRVWHDQALIKEPFANSTAWHLDNPYWSFYSRHAISIWIALEDATLSNGCMWFSPGSHRIATFDNVPIGEDFGALFKIYPEMAAIDPVAVPMKAGDCSFHNGLTAHGAGVNATRSRRIAMSCAYMPGGSTFNGQQNILSDDAIKRLTKGDVLADETQNPLVYES